MKNIKRIAIIALISISIFSGCAATGQTENIDIIDNSVVVTFATYNKSDQFTRKDLVQTVYVANAEKITLESGKDVVIDNEGTYIITGDVSNSSVIVNADDEAKVQIGLDNVSITNETQPAIYVKSADKVFVTVMNGNSSLMVDSEFVANDEDNLDAVIFSKSDLVLNGSGKLDIISNHGNGVSSKDDLKITGGTYDIQSTLDAIEANDSIRIYDGTININTSKDALHSENKDDDTLGYIYIYNCDMTISAIDDGIKANSVVQIDGGKINIENCLEGIEGTFVQINGGDVNIYSTDDGINAVRRSSSYNLAIEVNGGNINIEMAAGDTDAFDSNGDININGGTIAVNARSSFDASGNAKLNGGTVIINGEEVTELPKSMMGGGPRGGGMDGFQGRPPMEFDIEEIMEEIYIEDGILTLSSGKTYVVPEGETPKFEGANIIFSNGVEIDVHNIFGLERGLRPGGQRLDGEPPEPPPGMPGNDLGRQTPPERP